MKLFHNSHDGGKSPIGLIQCKQHKNPVSANLIREFIFVLRQQNVISGIFVSTSGFVKKARLIAEQEPKYRLQLWDDEKLLNEILRLEVHFQEELYEKTIDGDYTVPTCVRCNIKLVERTNGSTKKKFWGCNTPRCQVTMNARS